jgi:hypothetical protein
VAVPRECGEFEIALLRGKLRRTSFASVTPKRTSTNAFLVACHPNPWRRIVDLAVRYSNSKPIKILLEWEDYVDKLNQIK